MAGHPCFKQFIKIFDGIVGHQNRNQVFRDFITLAGITLHNCLYKHPKLEAEYLQINSQYDSQQQTEFAQLFAELVNLLEPEPTDILGQLYMLLELGNEHTGQFFTPPALSDLAASITGDKDNLAQTIKQKGFITLSDPACGAGGMVLSFAKRVIEAKLNPANVMWVECQDIDRTACFMCYIQLTLWHIPAVVIVGNTLTMENREAFYTLAHKANGWTERIRHRRAELDAAGLLKNGQSGQDTPAKTAEPNQLDPVSQVKQHAQPAEPSPVPASVPVSSQPPPSAVTRSGSVPTQLGFDFTR